MFNREAGVAMELLQHITNPVLWQATLDEVHHGIVFLGGIPSFEWRSLTEHSGE